MKTKNNMSTLILSSVICLLPLILSVAVYNDLPEQIAVHWNSEGEPDNFLPKATAAFGLPFLFLAINLFSKMHLYNDPKKYNSSTTIKIMVEWIIPLTALVLMPVTLFIAMGVNIPISVIAPAFTGVLLIILGNYLPKNRQNYTIGIKLPWTLDNADNWNKTHRMAGYLYIFGGIALVICSFIAIPSELRGSLIISIIVLIAIIPAFYSFLLYKKDGGDNPKMDN